MVWITMQDVSAASREASGNEATVVRASREAPWDPVGGALHDEFPGYPDKCKPEAQP